MKPFTSKHCAQYLTKSSPFNQEEPKKIKKDTSSKNIDRTTGKPHDDSEKGRKERLKREQRAGMRDKYGYQTSSYEK